MGNLPEEAVIAAARAIFEHSLLTGIDPATKMRVWLTEAGDYREVARAALAAALPYLASGQIRSPGSSTDSAP